MQAGKLDRRITLQRASTTKNGFNEDVEAWGDIATVWASATPVSDAERVRTQQVGAVISMRFQIRFSTAVADLSPTDRLTYNGKTYNITAVKELGRREGLEITAATRSDAGA